MQNKPNFKNDEMNISPVKTTHYAPRTTHYEQKNKPKTNPIYPELVEGGFERNLLKWVVMRENRIKLHNKVHSDKYLRAIL